MLLFCSRCFLVLVIVKGTVVSTICQRVCGRESEETFTGAVIFQYWLTCSPAVTDGYRGERHGRLSCRQRNTFSPFTLTPPTLLCFVVHLIACNQTTSARVKSLLLHRGAGSSVTFQPCLLLLCVMVMNAITSTSLIPILQDTFFSSYRIYTDVIMNDVIWHTPDQFHSKSHVCHH